MKEPIRLQFIRGIESILICDQDGRPLDDVQGWNYEDGSIDEPAILTVRIVFKESRWDELMACKSPATPHPPAVPIPPRPDPLRPEMVSHLDFLPRWLRRRKSS